MGFIPPLHHSSPRRDRCCRSYTGLCHTDPPNIAGKGLGIPVQEGPLPPEGAPRGSTHSSASWLGWPGKLFVLAAPAGGRRRRVSYQLVTITHIQGQPRGLRSGIGNKATRADDSVQKWLVLSASAEEVPLLLHGLPPTPRLQREKGWRRLKQR